MDFHLDTSWCPVCDRQILPKRLLIPVAQHSPPAPAPPPSSPRSISPTKPDAHTGRPSKNATIRARAGGLVHGTGRVKPNGALKRADSINKTHPPAPLSAKPAAPVKHRTIIDQGPIPLYCSDECQMEDIYNSSGAFGPDYDPHRSSPPLPPVPHNSYSDRTAISESESDSSGTSVDSCSSISTKSSSPPNDTPVSKSIATLAAMYNFPPIPPPPPVFPEDNVLSDSEHKNHYQSGIMMASRRLKEILCPERPRRAAYGPCYPPEPRKPIPGWTDGSTAWRSSVYSFSAPTDLATMDSSKRDDAGRAYQSFSASPHRSRGVYSTLSDISCMPAPCGSLPSKRACETELLYAKYSESLSRRSESRASLFPTSPTTSASPPTITQRRERPILKPGAEGKLLVPDVKMRVHGGSSMSLSSTWCGSSRRSTKSNLSDDAVQHHGDVATSLPSSKKATVETRSWSYDNFKTYPILQLPPKKEKRIERQVVNGKTIDVEVEVDVPIKRLFLFPGK